MSFRTSGVRTVVWRLTIASSLVALMAPTAEMEVRWRCCLVAARTAVSAAIPCILVAVAAAGPAVIEDWQRHPLGSIGVPAGWSELPFPHRLGLKLGALEIVEADGIKGLRLRTEDGQHTVIARPIAVDLSATPILVWTWKVVSLPAGADLKQRSRSDAAAVVLLSWARSKEIMGYAWDSTQAPGSWFENPKRPQVKYIVARSGTRQIGEWITERRDVRADYEKVFGKAPSEAPTELEISVDSNDTQSTAESIIGPIRFSER